MIETEKKQKEVNFGKPKLKEFILKQERIVNFGKPKFVDPCSYKK